jgi:hypothetical protein
MVITVLVVVSSAREWYLVLRPPQATVVNEAPFVETAVAG